MKLRSLGPQEQDGWKESATVRVLLEGIALDTTKYSENGDIHLTCVTDDDAAFEALSLALDSNDRVLDLRRGGEQLAVRMADYEVWPPYARRLEGTLHRHDIHLEFARAPHHA